MTQDVFDKVDPVSHTVLIQIQNGNTDIQQITEATTLPNHKINYRFTKLENLDLITVHRPSGRITRTINGQKTEFDAPKNANLTQQGKQYLEQAETDTKQYEDLSREELVEKVHRLENRINTLENRLQSLKTQVRQRL